MLLAAIEARDKAGLDCLLTKQQKKPFLRLGFSLAEVIAASGSKAKVQGCSEVPQPCEPGGNLDGQGAQAQVDQ